MSLKREIKKISINEAQRFVMRYGIWSSVAVPVKGEFFGCIIGEELVGIIGTQKIGKAVRIKSFLVSPRFRKQGIGSELLSYVFYPHLNYTAFATPASEPIFSRLGFVAQPGKRKIKYMKYEGKEHGKD